MPPPGRSQSDVDLEPRGPDSLRFFYPRFLAVSGVDPCISPIGVLNKHPSLNYPQPQEDYRAERGTRLGDLAPQLFRPDSKFRQCSALQRCTCLTLSSTLALVLASYQSPGRRFMKSG